MIDLLRSKLPRAMDVAPLRDAYPAGDEFILVRRWTSASPAYPPISNQSPVWRSACTT